MDMVKLGEPVEGIGRLGTHAGDLQIPSPFIVF